jgi:hypothetical protein
VLQSEAKKMESTVERQTKRIELDAETDTVEELVLTVPRQQAKRIYRAPTNRVQYAQPLGGLVAIVTLLVVPIFTIPGMIIPVLLAEVYLFDWTYSKLKETRAAKTYVSNESGKSPEDEIDGKVTRTGPRDQFMK